MHWQPFSDSRSKPVNLLHLMVDAIRLDEKVDPRSRMAISYRGSTHSKVQSENKGSTLKKDNNSAKKSEPTSKRAKSRGPVQRDAKEVMAEVLGKLTGKLAAASVSTSAQENRRGNTFGPNRDRLTVGVDLGDRWSPYCILGLEGERLAEGQLRTTQEDVGEFFRGLTRARVVVEVGTHSAWVRDVITECGHEVLVANPRLMEGSKRRKRKSDRIDANKLARLGRVDPQSLYPIRHRSREVRQDLVMLRARDALVSVRTELINTTRGLVKSMGTRLPRCSSPSFAEKVKHAIPVEVREALLPLVQLVETGNECITRYDQRIEELGRKKYGHTTLLRQADQLTSGNEVDENRIP